MSTALPAAINRAVAWFERLKREGIDLTGNAHLKVEKEAIEYADEPSLEEAADVFIALVGSLHSKGWTTYDLAVAVQEKMTVNEQRTWAKQNDGTYQHVKEEPQDPPATFPIHQRIADDTVEGRP